MAEGDLDNAQRTADLIVPHRRKAIPILDQIVASKDRRTRSWRTSPSRSSPA